MASPEGYLPPWDPGNKDQKTAVCHSEEFNNKLLGGVLGAKETLDLTDVWPHLRQLGVMDLKEKNRILVSKLHKIYLMKLTWK